MLVMAERDGDLDVVQLMPSPVVPSSGSVTVILYGTVSPKSANWPSSGISIVTVGARVADGDRDVVDAGQARLVGDRQLGVVVAGRRVGVGRVGGGRVGRAVAVEVPRVGERRALGVDASRRWRTGPSAARAGVGVRRGVRDRAPRRPRCSRSGRCPSRRCCR